MNATMMPNTTLRQIWLLAVLSLLLGFAAISSNLYLPAMPAMAVSLHASEGALQWVLSGNLFGFAVGQLFWGPLSDRYGRRVPIAFGSLLFAAGSVGCALSTNAFEIISWSVVQALGASAGVALARAMVRDLYDRDEAARILSTLMTVMSIAPLLGPSAGAQILAHASWEAIFWTLVGIALLAALVIFTLPESLPRDHRVTLSLKPVFDGYLGLFSNRVFVGYAAAIGFYYAGLFANIAGTPFAYINYYHLSPEVYALLFAAGIVGLIIANIFNAKLVIRVGTKKMFLVGAVGAALSGAFAAVVTASGWGGIYTLVAAIFVFNAMNGFVLANGVAGALSTIATRAGAASALLGTIQYGSGMIGSALVGLVANGTPMPMGALMLLGGAGSLVSVLLVERDGSGQLSKNSAHLL